MKPDFYNVGDKFNYNGTIYEIKTVTDNALEVFSHGNQSLWISLEQLHKDLGLDSKSALFHWQHKYLVDAS